MMGALAFDTVDTLGRTEGTVSTLRDQVIDLVRARGYRWRSEPFELASGELSHDYIDGKRAVGHGDGLRLVAAAALNVIREEFDAVGGLTMGADPIAHAIAYAKPSDWFSVRKQPKGRGLNRWIEGSELGGNSRVVIVDDVVTTGGSALSAYERVRETGATVVAAIALVDRGEAATNLFGSRGVPYYKLVTYRDLQIEPVGRLLTSSSG
jgi:orotate phosphoribosyltransferase